MSLENDFKTMQDILTRELLDTKSDLSAGKLESANEKFDFVSKEVTRWTERLEDLEGSHQGIAGIIFRHKYHVPEDLLQMRDALAKQVKSIQTELERENEKARNKAARQKAREVKTEL